jgi:magnesium transporter
MARPPLVKVLPLTRTLPLRAVAGTRRPTAEAMSTPLPVPVPRLLLDAAVDWALYTEGVRTPNDDFDTACEKARAGEGFVWLGLHDPTTNQLAQLGEVFDLHPLALEDAANPRQRAKVERYDDVLFLALRTLAYIERPERHSSVQGGEIVETGAVMVFVGEYFAITVRHGRHASMVGLRRRLETRPQQLALGPSAVLHAVCDKVVDDYLAVADQVNEDIEEIENSVFATRTVTDVERIYQLKRDIIEMKRTTGPLALPLHELSERPRRLVHPDIREYFRDVSDHLARVRDQIQGYDELLGSILQAGLARLTVSENEDMRKISAWVAIAAVPTMIAGIYGMNFVQMPELHQVWGYPAVLTLMVTCCAAMYRGFKRNRWL